MFQQILPNIYRVEVPLPKNPLKSLNSYVLKGPERNLIIDTGMNRAECKAVILPALDKLEIDAEKTDFFITHMHADHSGLVTSLAASSSTIYFSEPDGDVIKYGDPWHKMREFAGTNGFPEHELQQAIDNHPGNKYSSSGQLDYTEVKDGQILVIGEYKFRCILTPGHTKGHMCLYEPVNKILISGDHILKDITPNISLALPEQGNPLKEYMESLDKVYQLEVKLVLPGHRSMFENHRERIDELKQHHQLRVNEVLSILKSSSQTAYDTASAMSWDIKCESWDEFPIPQKWFATGEAAAHLKYLEGQGQVRQESKNGLNVYSLTE
ncbi:MBL fold metallo-hydrolase [Metallumcola ferriviriculae]|uniref:MBL fold metallo-hydrolase n=1 Tax=Metallumcola ferriviriculae TaxID=3039180 RepID=A0AAU0UPB9_9FIRM|nr:MBL fold metallo-hydrolase [Desulfitibacteraceae bacterium MK1]